MNNSLLNPELTLSCQHWNLNAQKISGLDLSVSQAETKACDDIKF